MPRKTSTQTTAPVAAEPVAVVTSVSPWSRWLSKQFFIRGAVVCVIVLLVAVVIWQYRVARGLRVQLREVQDRLAVLSQNTTSAPTPDAEVAALVAKVSQLIAVPNNEQPTVATVTDPAQLQQQPFFAQARTGDKVLIYTTAKKAIIYRPSENRIIEVGPISNSKK